MMAALIVYWDQCDWVALDIDKHFDMSLDSICMIGAVAVAVVEIYTNQPRSNCDICWTVKIIVQITKFKLFLSNLHYQFVLKLSLFCFLRWFVQLHCLTSHHRDAKLLLGVSKTRQFRREFQLLLEVLGVLVSLVFSNLVVVDRKYPIRRTKRGQSVF